MITLLMMQHAVAQGATSGKDGFYAQLSETHMVEGGVVRLKVILRGHTPNGEPDLRGIEDLFTIVQRSKQEEISIMQGQYERVLIWHYQLLPKRAGRLTVPGIWLQTNAGTMRTDPMHVSVADAATAARSQPQVAKPAPSAVNQAQDDVYAKWLLPSPAPYVGQPVLATLQVWTSGNVVDVQLGQATADGAKIEPLGEPQSMQERRGRSTVQRTDIRYLITPISNDEVVLKPIAMRANVMSRGRMPSAQDLMNGQNPFDVFNRMMRGMGGVEAVNYQTAKEAINPLPIPAQWPGDASDWLPLRSLEISQKIDTSIGNVGEPVQRTITIVAQSAYSEQLPDVAALHEAALDKTVWQQYPEKAVEDSMLRESPPSVRSWTIHRLNLVPIDNGEQSLPEIAIPWWDVVNHELRYARAPAYPFVIHGTPVPVTKKPTSVKSGAERLADSTAAMPALFWPAVMEMWNSAKAWLPMLVGLLVMLCAVCVAWFVMLALKPKLRNAAKEPENMGGLNAKGVIFAKDRQALWQVLGGMLAQHKALVQLHETLERQVFGNENAASLWHSKLAALRAIYMPKKHKRDAVLPPLNPL